MLFAAAEADPIIKVGGLGDVTGSLPHALCALEPEDALDYTMDIRLAIPYHAAIRSKIANPELVASFSVPHPAGAIPAQAYQASINCLPVYLIDGEPISAEPGVYSQDARKAGEKFTFFSLAILELARALNWAPDVLHAHDWHAALAVYLLCANQSDTFFANTHAVLTVHNLPFMGAGTQEALADYGIPAAVDARLPAWAQTQPLPMGMAAADYLTTVSPTYAREILTPEFGSGLQDFLQLRAGTLYGILNGLDEDAWNPAADAALAQPFDARSLEKRAANKKALLKEMDLPDLNVPLLVFVGRMDRQKGVDLAVDALRQIADLPWQAILLGTGDLGLQSAVLRLEAEFPLRVKAAVRFDAQLSRRMYAGGDMLLMPSRYEPCGLAQMIAMRYGCIPVARATGGLRDTILDQQDAAGSTGFLFETAAPEALAGVLRRALAAYTDREGWQARMKCGMKQDFSWKRSAQSYARLYHKLIVQPE